MKAAHIILFLALISSVFAQTNLLVNPGAETGDFTGWTINPGAIQTDNCGGAGGSGWCARSGIKLEGTYSVSSTFFTSTMNQEIDLIAQGYTPAELDSAPEVNISTYVIGFAIFPDIYRVRAELRDASHAPIASFDTGELTIAGSWQRVSHSFSGYGSGLRYIYFEQGGRDTEFWAGAYGATFDNASIYISNASVVQDGEDNDKKGMSSMSVSLETSCDGNVVTVSEGDDAVPGARVAIMQEGWGTIALGESDSGGGFSFSGCGMDVDIHVTKSDYYPEDLSGSLISCGQCEEECASDGDCPETSQCSADQCVPVECGCGVVQNHICSEYECCSDTDCTAGEICENNECQPSEEPGCISDENCANTQYCDVSSGNCMDVQPGDCGEIKDHSFVPYGYECGPEPGCPPCPADEVCAEHECVASEIEVEELPEAQPEKPEKPLAEEPDAPSPIWLMVWVVGLLVLVIAVILLWKRFARPAKKA